MSLDYDLAYVRQALPQNDSRAALDRVETELARLQRERDEFRIEADHGHDDYEDAEEVIFRIAEARPNKTFDPWARGLCQHFLDRPNRSRATIAGIRERQVVAEAEAQGLRKAVLKHRGRAEAAERELTETKRLLREEQQATDDSATQRYRAETAERELARLREGLRQLLDCKGSYNGTVTERGGEPAVCTKCEAMARALLAEDGAA